MSPDVLNQALLVSTDLDGTLLDHYSYSWEAASPAIERLKVIDAPIIINTSKTFQETVNLQHQLEIDAPFIVENGSAIYAPVNGSPKLKHLPSSRYSDYSVILLGSPRKKIIESLQALRSEHSFIFESYTDWDTEKIIEITGLNTEGAIASQNREYSEPMIWSDSEENFETFSKAVDELGYRIIYGGRFIHILGKSNKGLAIQKLQQLVEHSDKVSRALVCLGDSRNDVDMLNIADYPVFIKSNAHTFPAHDCKNTPIFSSAEGPAGWNESISSILDSLNQEKRTGSSSK